MASLKARGRKLYAKIKNADGDWQRVVTPFLVGQDDAAQKWADDLEAEFANERAVKAGASGPLTITLYARAWLNRRKNKTNKDDRTRMEKHVLPRIGNLLVTEARPRHFRDLIVALKGAGELAPKTIRHISGLVHSLFESAIIDELVAENPVKYEKGVLPKKADKDPSWRRQAIYTRDEIEQLISDARVPEDRRMLYALKFFTGRHSEVSRLTWEQHDADAKPLGSLALDETKTEVPRLTPVHQTLAAMLTAWREHGWEDFYGHKPKPTDLIVPTRNLSRRTANEAQRQLLYDLEKIGLRTKAGKERNRRGHDLRRTLISLARLDGAIDSVLKVITHGPSTQAILDLYSSYTWDQLCTEIGKLKIESRNKDSWSMFGPSSQHVVSAPENKRPRRDSNPGKTLRASKHSQSERSVTDEQALPNAAGESGLDQTMVQLLTSCDVAMVAMRTAAVRSVRT